MAYSSVTRGVGSTGNRFRLSLANRNYTTQYFQSVHASGDIRIQYLHDRFTSTGGGEVIRAVAEAYGTGCAAGATINAAHFTGRVADGMTVSGALNAVRATLEVANDSGSVGGTLAALQLDSNIAHDNAMGDNDAFIRVTDSGAHAVTNLFNFEQAKGSAGATTGLICTDHANDIAANTFIKCRINGTTHWLMATSTAPAAS